MKSPWRLLKDSPKHHRTICMNCKWPHPEGPVPKEGECSCYYNPPTRWFTPEAETQLSAEGKLTGKGENE
jgi:hypothetical protein